MRILQLSNFYPPHARGGYEQWCQEVTDGLRSRGHDVLVLTSRHRVVGHQRTDPPWVRRELHLETSFQALRNSTDFFLKRHARDRANLETVRKTVSEYAPDHILIWGMWNIPRSVPATVERLLPNQVSYYLGDYWPTLPRQYEAYWNSPARSWPAAVAKAPLAAIAKWIVRRESAWQLALRNLMFPSQFMRDEFSRRGIRGDRSAIVRGAIDTGRYRESGGIGHRGRAGHLALVWVGRLTPEKGTHTVIEALGVLLRQGSFPDLRLTIVGGGDPEYEARLRHLVHVNALDDIVDFTGPQGADAMPPIYGQADVLVFTSIWPEPFGRVVVEAMASGVVVVGTATGGAGEILRHDENALVFEAADAEALAANLTRLHGSPALCDRLATQAWCEAHELYTIERMTKDIEDFLRDVT